MMDVAIERAKSADRSACGLGKADAIALGAWSDAREHAIGARGYVLRHHLRIGREATVGNDDRFRFDSYARTVLLSDDSPAGAVLDHKLDHLGAAHQLAASLHEIVFELPHDDVAATAFPVETRDQPARGRQHLLARLVLLQRTRNEAGPLSRQPVDGALAIVRDRARQIGLGGAAAAAQDR